MLRPIEQNMQRAFEHLAKLDQTHCSSLIFTDYEKALITRCALFANISNQLQTHHLSAYGGLGWFMSQTLDLILKDIQNGKKLKEESRAIFYKLSHLAVFLSSHIDLIKIREEDRALINSAKLHANLYVQYSIESIS
ncbi:MAG: hypothetical protein GXO35_03820 [Gammaproteobacteria bacterium]|nr:hypothetical protein [Gammaproteobacteria bacterium]